MSHKKVLLQKDPQRKRKLFAAVLQVFVMKLNILYTCSTCLVVCISPSGLQRMPSTSESEMQQASLKGGHLSAWGPEHDSSETIHPELHEYNYSCQEQMVPAARAYQPYRFELPALVELQQNEEILSCTKRSAPLVA